MYQNLFFSPTVTQGQIQCLESSACISMSEIIYGCVKTLVMALKNKAS